MFLQNKYTRCYFSIIQRALSRTLIDNGYIEKHHIIPKSLGGTDEINNIVKLTSREHFVCHQLLIRMLSSKNRSKMVYALWRMCNSKKNPYKITSRVYGASRKRYTDIVSKRIVSDDTRKKMSKSRRITHRSDEFRERASIRAKNRSKEHSQKIGDAHKGKTISVEMRQKQSEKLSGVNNPRALSWKIIFEDGSPSITVTSLKTWCAEIKVSYGMMFRTSKIDKYHKGIKAVKV